MKRDLLILFFLLFNLNFIFADCGNGILESGEQCDDGNYISRDGCSYSCYNETYRSSYCGDNVIFIGIEDCDDGNFIVGDSCAPNCTKEVYDYNVYCGDDVLFLGKEQCDDGINGISGDGCYDDCTNVTYNSIYCGDGFLFPVNESCDDGNLINHDGCSNICKKESYSNTFCGDNILFVGFEDCDDGNKISGDECSSTCDFEYCGDGILTPSFGEKCDDANPIVGDGCSMNCTIETYNTSMCGDGIIFPGYEECDDHNLDSSDGCSNNCLFETCTNGVNLNVYSVTDISGSMTIKECADTRPFYCCLFNDCDIANTCINTCHGTYYQRMDLAQRANKAFIENLFKVSGNEVGLVTYATVSNDTGYHELSNNSVSLINTIDSWASYGRTCICCGVLNAIDKMVNESDSSAYKVLVVMSDGEANIQCLDKYPSLSSENAAIQASCDAYEDYGIVVHTVGFGADAGKKTLQKMADCGHGRYYSGDFDLVDVYKQISQDIMLNMSCNVCGNGILESGEECDDNNSINGDGCSSICKNETICGNGIKEFPEECDDKNLINGDGCSNVCILQPEVYWLNSNGVRITQAHVGDTVKII